jgi:DNA primase
MLSPVEKIKERLSIVDVISSYLTVNQSGSNYKAKCPFHNEKTPSFFISPDRGTYYCFGCGAKGDIFSFVEKFEGTDFLGSLKILADRAGVVLDKWNKDDSHDDKEKWYEILEEATRFFEASFDKNQKARAYLKGRGLSDETIKTFRIGYALPEWRSVTDYLLKKGYKLEDLEIVGLTKKKDKNYQDKSQSQQSGFRDGFYDRFRGRIIFPISDSSGRVIAFSGRTFKDEVPVVAGKPVITDAKYLNSPDTPLFNKSNVLFGIDKAKSAIRTRGYSIIVEGQMDLLMSHQSGFSNTVAVSGTALADNTGENDLGDNIAKINNLGLIRRLSPNIIFAFDGDEAGIRASGRASMIALSLDMQVKIAVIPEGKDPADIILESVDKWKDIIKNSVDIISFHLDRICSNTKDSRIQGQQIKDIIFPFLSMIKSSIEKSAYITLIYSKTSLYKSTGLSEAALIKDFENYERNNINKKEIPKQNIKETNLKSKRENLEQLLFGIIFSQEKNGEQIDKNKELYDLFKKIIGEEVFQESYERHKLDLETLAFETEKWYGNNINMVDRDIRELIFNLEEEILIEEKTSLQPLDTEEKLIKFNNILKRIEEIRQTRFL